MKTNYEQVIKQGEWLLKNLPSAKKQYSRKAYDYITPIFNKEFKLNFTKKQVKARLQHYKERLMHPEKAYKFSPLSRTYTKEELDKFYNWLIKQEMSTKKQWEDKWFEITRKKLSYRSITQRLFQYGYRWSGEGKLRTWGESRSKHKVGDLVQRKNNKDKDVKVNWIKIKTFDQLTDEEKQQHLKYKKFLEKSPCWQRHDRYVLEQKGIEVENKYIVHLNGNTLDDSFDNLYLTDNYHEYNALKIKGMCDHPLVVKASLETKQLMRKVEELM